jgi:DNA-binding CsgD family transcriptional regulator
VTTPLVGREAERRGLDDALEAAASGNPGAVVLDGEPGVGKSRLVTEFVERARDGGATVLRGGCLDLAGGALPYLPLVDMLRGFVRRRGAAQVRELAEEGWPELARLVPALAAGTTAPPAHERSPAHLMEAVLRLLVGCADEAPTIVAVEDLHWIDRSAADLTTYVVRALTDERLLVVGTCRPDGGPVLRSLLAGLSGSGRLLRRAVEPLPDLEIADLVRGVAGGGADAGFVAQVVARAGGNPFFARELALSGPGGDGFVPAGVRDLVQARLDRAGTQARQVAGVVAAAGRPVDHPLVAAACPLATPDLLAALRACVAHDVLAVDAAQRYTFRHALTRDAVYAEMLPGERAGAHLALAGALAARPELGLPAPAAATAELAHHWEVAGDRPRAFTASVAAGAAAAAVFGYAEAERQYERALALRPAAGTEGPDLPDLLLAAADAARWSGRVELAVSRVEQGIAALDAHAPRARIGALQERRGRYLWESGNVEASLRAYADAGTAYGSEPPSAGQAWALAGHATALVQTGRLRDAVRVCREALAVAAAAEAPAAAGRARNTLGTALTLLGSQEEGIAELREAVRIAVADGNLEDILRGHANLGFALETAGRLEESLTATLDGVRRSRDVGLDLTGGALLLVNAASVLVMLGRWDEAEEMLDHAGDRRPPPGFDRYRRVVLAELGVGRGRFADAREQVAPIAATAVDEPQLAAPLYALGAEALLWEGRSADALARVEEGLAALGTADDPAPVLRLAALGLRAAADHRDIAHTDRVLVADLEVRVAALWSRVETADASLPVAVATRALCAAERSRTAGADDPRSWDEVAAGWDRLAQPYPAAYARFRRAEAMIRDGARLAATAPLTAARATRLGAVPLLRAADVLARAARLVLDRPEPPPPPRDVPFGLTPRESDVLALLADGLTNRQIARRLFVGEKTAGVHVSNILRKLGVPNRGQAAAVARRTGVVRQ